MKKNVLLMHTVKKKQTNQPKTRYWYHGSDLVQGAYRNFADIIRDVFPGGALSITGGHALSVPKVFWTGNHIIKIAVSIQINKVCGCFTVFIHSMHWGSPHRHLLQLLSGWRGNVIPTFSCRGTHNREQHQLLFYTFSIAVLDPLTCWALWGDRTPVKGRTISGNGPNLAGSPDRDRLERLVGSHMEPGRTLRQNRRATTMLEKPPSIIKIKKTKCPILWK